MSQQLIDSLINEKISLNELKDWINSSSNKELLETTKYEFITCFVSNIHLSTNWLTNNNNNNQNNNNSKNYSSIKLSSNKSYDRNYDKNESKKLLINKLSQKIENIDLKDENLFPTLGSQTIVSNSLTTSETSVPIISTTVPTINTTVLCRRKRIKPTPIKGDEQISLGFFSNSRDSKGKPIRKEWIKSNKNSQHIDNIAINSFESNKTKNKTNSESNDSLKAEREWLKKAKNNEIIIKNSEYKTQNMDSIKIDSNKMPTIEANPNSITNSNQLEVIINIYAIILKSNLVPNFIEELKFICELVTKRVTKEFNHEIDPQMNLFLSSYHNCVYFSVKLLEELLLNQRLINCLNKTTLKLMIESINITKFSPLLKENLMLMLETDKPVNNNANNNLKTTLESVLFQSETDTKSNFPNDHSFHLFRKQRDEFYQIYNNYRQKDNALKGGKESNLKIINSIKHLFSLSRDSGNMSHLSRLFVSQLLQSCVNRGLCSQNTDFSEETTDDNETVRNLLPDRERLRKLQKRFNKSSTKLWDTNLFSKEEQFFRDFIFYGDSHAFNEHLKYLLSHKLLEFNSFEVLNFDNDLNEVQVLRNRFRNNLITLKIIAKFLAYVTFYPFDTTLSNNNVQEFIESQTRLRSQSKPLIDLENCLREAIEKNKLLMTVPWIVEFLCFIDPISARIVYYQNLSNFLVVIYKTYLPNIIHFCPTNGLFILFYLTKVFINKNLDLNERFYRIIFKDNYFDKPNINSSDNSLDFLSDLIDSDFFHDFCPHFNNDLTLIFKHNVVNEVRKITPLTMPLIDKDVKQLIDDKKDNNDEQLRLQIEEQFFNSHSPSLKKTVDFVSDRITSKCIKKVRTEIFMQSKQSFYNSNVKNNEEFICDKIRSQCKSFVKDYCTQQTNTIFPLLMNEDIDESVLQFSIKIAIKLAIDKCINWIDNNITQSLIENDLKTELENMTKQLNEKEESEKDQKKKEESVVVDISSTFTSIRDLMADLYEDKPINDNSIIVKLVNELSELKRSKTLPKKTLEFIDVNIVDFSIALIANQPKILSDTIIKLFIDYWVEFNITVEKYICPRNVYILSICKSPNLSWSKFESFLLNMLSKQIVSPLIIENDCLWTLKEEWDDSVLNRFASCLKSIVNFNQINGKNGDMLDTIDWLSWFCSQSD